MNAFLKVFFGIILIMLGLLVIFSSPFASLFFGGAGFVVQLVLGIAVIAGGITLFIKVRA